MKLVDENAETEPVKATVKMARPESAKLLRIAVPTPMQQIDPVPAASFFYPLHPHARSTVEEVRNAVLLFFVLLGGCGLVAAAVVAAFFR